MMIPNIQEVTKLTTDRESSYSEMPISFDELVERSIRFEECVARFPLSQNRITVLGNFPEQREKIAAHAHSARPLVSKAALELMSQFLNYKRESGSDQEKALYAALNATAFITRLLKQRPVVFMGAQDVYQLREGVRGSGYFETVGTPNEAVPLILANYLSYEEMPLSALVSVAVRTLFINSGDRNNQGRVDPPGTFEREGVIIGLVGARLEKPGYMEWQHLVVSRSQNRKENGYGADPTPLHERLTFWAKFYHGKSCFPLFEEAVSEGSARYEQIDADTYFDKVAYKKRIRLSILPFLAEANRRAQEVEKKAYVLATGIGLGVWRLTESQNQLMLEVYAELFTEYRFESIRCVNLGWLTKYPDSFFAYCASINVPQGIVFDFTPRPIAEKLPEWCDQDLLVASYAWDGNSFPGNEYWWGMLNASGDPAAASCSTIAELQNPFINLRISGEAAYIVS